MTEIQQLLAEGLNSLLAKQDDLNKAKAYYDGNMTEIYASPQVKRALAKAGSWSLNYCAIPVQAVANRLNVLKVSSEAARANKLLASIADTSTLDITFNEIITSTLKYGHSYASVAMTGGEVEIYSVSPLTTHVVYKQDRPRVADYAVRLWQTSTNGKTTYRANLYTDTAIYKFVSDQMPHTVTDSTFTHIGTDSSSGIPIIEFMTGPDKLPEHAPGYSAQDALTKSYTAQLAAIDFASFPVRVALSDSTEANDFSDQDQASALSASPGQITLMQGYKSVAQLEPLPPSQYSEPINHLIRQLANLTQTPLTHFQDYQKSNVSGEGTRATEAAFYSKCRNRQAYIDRSLKQLLAFVLRLKNVSGDIDIDWANVESTDKGELWSWKYKQIQSGLPVRQMLLESGYTQDQIDEWEKAGLLTVVNPQTNQLEAPNPVPSNNNNTEKESTNGNQ